jgi:hypothetical protein
VGAGQPAAGACIDLWDMISTPCLFSSCPVSLKTLVLLVLAPTHAGRHDERA